MTTQGVRVMKAGRYAGTIHVARYIELLPYDDLIVTDERYTSGLILRRYDSLSLLAVEELAAKYRDRLTVDEAKLLRRYRWVMLIEDGEGKVDARLFDAEEDLERVWSEALRVAQADPDIEAELVPRTPDGTPIH